MKYAIFDVDGVLLSEERCFDVSALVVWEWFNSPTRLGLDNKEIWLEPTDESIAIQRAYIWCNDAILSWMKGYNINSNWDMVHAYLVATIAIAEKKRKTNAIPLREQKSGEEYSFKDRKSLCLWAAKVRGITVTPEEVFAWLKGAIPVEITQKNDFFRYLRRAAEEVFQTDCAWTELNSSFYTMHTDCFQDWYLGAEEKGKPGFLSREVPLAPPEKIADLFRGLTKRGYTVCIGTGRGLTEVQIPFEALGWWQLLDPNHIATADEALAAEQAVPGEALDKPNPFTFRAAAWGTNREKYSDYVLRPEMFYDSGDEYYIIGDSPADVTAAKAMGPTVMIATLTGLTGEKSRAYFEKENVRYIISNILDVEDVLQ